MSLSAKPPKDYQGYIFTIELVNGLGSPLPHLVSVDYQLVLMERCLGLLIRLEGEEGAATAGTGLMHQASKRP